MINSVSDLLNEFIKAEVEVLNIQEIKHPTTIGSMFEGLTEHILNKSVFSELNLRVIKNSFIIGCKTEFDDPVKVLEAFPLPVKVALIV